MLIETGCASGCLFSSGTKWLGMKGPDVSLHRVHNYRTGWYSGFIDAMTAYFPRVRLRQELQS